MLKEQRSLRTPCLNLLASTYVWVCIGRSVWASEPLQVMAVALQVRNLLQVGLRQEYSRGSAPIAADNPADEPAPCPKPAAEHVVERPPLDWSLKTRMLITSTRPFQCCRDMLTATAFSGALVLQTPTKGPPP